jgi:hypothetical protein
MFAGRSFSKKEKLMIRSHLIIFAALLIGGALAFAVPIYQWRFAASATGTTAPFEDETESRRAVQPAPQRVARDDSFRSIVGKVPPNVRAEFLESLMFKNGGLATAYIGGLKSGLTPAQYKQVFLALGVDDTKDYEDYECKSTATCSKKKDSICISRNCVIVTRPATLGQMLTQVPANNRSQFLDSLDFANGKLVSAGVGSVKARLRQAEFDQLFDSLGVSRAELQRTTGGTFSRQ